MAAEVWFEKEGWTLVSGGIFSTGSDLEEGSQQEEYARGVIWIMPHDGNFKLKLAAMDGGRLVELSTEQVCSLGVGAPC